MDRTIETLHRTTLAAINRRCSRQEEGGNYLLHWRGDASLYFFTIAKRKWFSKAFLFVAQILQRFGARLPCIVGAAGTRSGGRFGIRPH